MSCKVPRTLSSQWALKVIFIFYLCSYNCTKIPSSVNYDDSVSLVAECIELGQVGVMSPVGWWTCLHEDMPTNVITSLDTFPAMPGKAMGSCMPWPMEGNGVWSGAPRTSSTLPTIQVGTAVISCWFLILTMVQSESPSISEKRVGSPSFLSPPFQTFVFHHTTQVDSDWEGGHQPKSLAPGNYFGPHLFWTWNSTSRQVVRKWAPVQPIPNNRLIQHGGGGSGPFLNAGATPRQQKQRETCNWQRDDLIVDIRHYRSHFGNYGQSAISDKMLLFHLSITMILNKEWV